MTNQQHFSKVINFSLWVSQCILAGTLVWAGYMKLFQPEQVALMWPWAGEVPTSFVKITGVIDLLGGTGLIFPALLRIKPILTPIAAIGVIVLMICASVFHISRGEASSIGANIVFAIIAAFIAWGRFKKAPVLPK